MIQKAYGRVSDFIFFYGDRKINSDAVRMPLNPDYVEKFYRYEDKRGVYRAGDLSSKGLSGGGYDYNFHGHMGHGVTLKPECWNWKPMTGFIFLKKQEVCLLV